MPAQHVALSRGAMLGLIGGTLGLCASMMVLFVANIGNNLGSESTDTYVVALLTMLLSAVGLAGCFLDGMKMASGVLMWIAAGGILLVLSSIGWISVAAFLLGGAVLLLEARREKAMMPSAAPSPMPPVVAPPMTSHVATYPQEQGRVTMPVPPPSFEARAQPTPSTASQGQAAPATVRDQLRFTRPSRTFSAEHPPAPEREEPVTEEEPMSSDDEYYEPPRQPWTRKQWRDNIIAALAILGILVAALFAAWYLYIR